MPNTGQDVGLEYARVRYRTVTMYPEHWDAVDALARKRHRGKASAALQEIVDRYIASRSEVATTLQEIVDHYTATEEDDDVAD